MQKLVVKSKLTLPLTERVYWNNRTLYNKFLLIDKYPLTLIQAPLGYGKTKNLSLFLKNNFSRENLFWYSVYKTDNNMLDFWNNLVCLLYKGKSGQDNLFTNQESKLDLYNIIDVLINFLDELTDETILVIDNYQLIDNYKIKKSLSYFIDLLPVKIHLVLLSRAEIKFPQISSWKINGKVLIIDKENFILNQNNMEKFLLIQHHLQLNPKEIEEIAYFTEGWIAAINFIAELIKAGTELTKIINKSNKYFNIFYEYLDYEILCNEKTLNPYLKEYLIKSSILKEIDQDIYEVFVDLDDCHRLLEEYLRIGLPIKKNNSKSYRFNRLFKAYLYSKAKKEYDDLEELHNKAFKIYKDSKDFEGEIYHILKLDDKEKLALFIEERAEVWIEKERYDLLKNALITLAEDKFNDFPVLYLYQGDLHFSENNLELALHSYQQAEKLLEEKDNEKLFIKALLKISKVYFSVHSIQGLEWLNKLEKYEKRLSKKQQYQYLSYRIISMFITGDLKDAICLIKQLKKTGGKIDKFTAMKAFMEGNLEEAANLIEVKEKDYILQSIYMLILLFTGEKYRLLELLWRKMNSSSGVIRLLYRNLQLSCYQIIGSYRKGDIRGLFKDLQQDSKDSLINTSWHIRQTKLAALNWEANLGNPDLGIEFAKKSLTDLNEQDDFFKVHLYHMLGINYYAKADWLKSERYLNKAKKIVDSQGNRINLAVSLYWLALCKYKQGLEYSQIIRRLLRLSRENSYDFLFTKANILSILDLNQFIPLLLEARERGIEGDYVYKLLEQINLSNIEQHPGYSLQIKTFGGFELYRGKERIKEEEWKRSKAKELLYVFLVNYQKKIFRERLYNYLWPEKDDKSAKQNFYVTLGSLNKILEPNRDSSQEACFIESNNSRYGITREFTYFYDVSHFEGFINRGQNSDDKEISIKYYMEAINIYQGNFLPEVSGLEWLDQERERLKSLFTRHAIEVMEYHYQNGDYQFCIELANKVETIDPYIDELYLYKMKSYYQLGKWGSLVKTYRECNSVFREELGVSPNPGVENFYQQIAVGI